MSYQSISCQSYDYIEIACLHHLRVKLVLHSGESIEGVAQTTRIHDSKEFLQLEYLQNNEVKQTEIRLDVIKTLECLDNNCPFDTIQISGMG